MMNYTNNLIKIIDQTLKKNNLNKICEIIIKQFQDNKKILMCGNGGSASQANHLNTELIVKYSKHDRKSLPSICLSNSGDLITAHANDFEFNTIFSRQINSLGKQGDVLIVFTTSGKSQNILNACHVAKNKKMLVIGLTGNNNNLDNCCDYVWKVNSNKTSHIQEMHLIFIHLLCEKLEKIF